MQRVRRLSATASGVGVALLGWLALVPWDLSEVGPDGLLRGAGGDDHAGVVALAAGVVVAVAVGLVPTHGTRSLAPWFAAGGLPTWAVLFAWRAGAAETVGANLFVVPLVFAVVPTAIGVPVVLRRVAQRRDAHT